MLPAVLAFILAISSVVRADPGPLTPPTANEGTTCTISWTPDATGTWKTTYIELMTGPNLNMVHLSTVATVDTTDSTKTSFSYPCLKVTPNSNIYFYQFTSSASPTPLWTTRFTLAGPHGETTPPANLTQPGGGPNANVPWGTGKLVNPADGTPPPPTVKGGQASGSVSPSGSIVVSSTPVVAPGPISTAPASSVSPIVSSPLSSSLPPASSSAQESESPSASESAPSSSPTSGASAVVVARIALVLPVLASLLFL